MGLFNKKNPDEFVEDMLVRFTPNQIRMAYNLPLLDYSKIGVIKIDNQDRNSFYHSGTWDALRYSILNGGMNEMKKKEILFSDLREFDIIETEHNEKFILIGDYFYNSDLQRVMRYPIIDYLVKKQIWLNGARVVNVYQTCSQRLKEAFIPFNLKLKISRIESKKMTVSDIEKVLGYPIEIVKEGN